MAKARKIGMEFPRNLRVAPPGEKVGREPTWTCDLRKLLPPEVRERLRYGKGALQMREDYYMVLLRFHAACRTKGVPFPVMMADLMERWMENPTPPREGD